jgi:hypothetical protein
VEDAAIYSGSGVAPRDQSYIALGLAKVILTNQVNNLVNVNPRNRQSASSLSLNSKCS